MEPLLELFDSDVAEEQHGVEDDEERAIGEVIVDLVKHQGVTLPIFRFAPFDFQGQSDRIFVDEIFFEFEDFFAFGRFEIDFEYFVSFEFEVEEGLVVVGDEGPVVVDAQVAVEGGLGVASGGPDGSD